MARDLRMGINDMPDRCYYYSSTAVKGNKLVADAQPLGRFNKTDVVPFGWKPITVNGSVTSQYEWIGTCETYDECWDLRPGMFVEENNILMLVVSIEVSDGITHDDLCARPAMRTVMVLRGVAR